MSEMRYLDFDLLIERSPGGSGYRARISSSPAGRAETEFELPFSDLEIENFFLRVGRTRRGVRRLESPEMQAAKVFGSKLFETVFDQEVRGCLRSSLDEADRQGAGLRIRLCLTGVPELAELPWEYLHNTALNRFLVLSAETPLVRYIDLPEPIRPLAIQPPLRVLVMIASPNDYPALDVEKEWTKLKEAVADLEERGLLVVERLESATLVALQRQLRRGEYHIFHFVGHGAFDEQSQDGLLLLEDEAGRGRAMSGQYLGTLMHDERTLRLAILNACEGARTSRSDPFAGAAQSLVQQGIPAVIAMQFEITDEAAIALAHEFYAALADGYPVDAALAEARKAIFARGNDVEWGTPVLYLRSPDGHIFDVEQIPEAERAQAQVDSLLRRAQEAEARQDWESVAKSLRGVLDLDPAHSQAAVDLHRAQDQQKLTALYARGCQLYQEERWHESLRAFRQVQQVDGEYRDVGQWIAAVEQRLSAPSVETPERPAEEPPRTAAVTPEEPAPQPAPRKKKSWLWIGLPIALVALLVLCGGGYAVVKWVQSRLSTPTPAVVKTTPRVTSPAVKITPVTIATPTPTPKVPTRVVTRRVVLATPLPLQVIGTATPTPASKMVDMWIIAAGTPFKDPIVVEVLVLSVPWDAMREEYYPDQKVSYTVEILGETFTLDSQVEYNPDVAREMLNDLYAGQETGLQVYVMAAEGDPGLEATLIKVANTLTEVGIEVYGPELVDRETFLGLQDELIETGRGVLWLDRR